MRSARRPRSPSITISRRCIGWAPSCRCRRASSSRRPALRALAAVRARRQSASPGRAVPAGAHRRLRRVLRRRPSRLPDARPRARRMPTLPAYDSPAAFIADLDVIEHSLATHHAALARRAPADAADPRGAKRSASISPRSTCGRTPTCTRRSIGELLRARGRRAPTTWSCRRRSAWRSWCARSPRRGRWCRRTSTTASARAPSLRSWPWPRTSIAATARPRCRTTSSRSASRSRTCSRSPCC